MCRLHHNNYDNYLVSIHGNRKDTANPHTYLTFCTIIYQLCDFCLLYTVIIISINIVPATDSSVSVAASCIVIGKSVRVDSQCFTYLSVK